MPNTSLGIYYPDESTNITPLHTVLGAISTSVDGYLQDNATVHTVANVAGRAALVAAYPPSVSSPLILWRQDLGTGAKLEYTVDGTTWGTIGTPSFDTEAARDAAIAAPVAGMKAVTGTGATLVEWVYSGTTWVRGWVPTQSVALSIGSFTLGNGTLNGYYQRVGDWVDAQTFITLGSTSAITGNLTVTPPIAWDPNQKMPVGQLQLWDTSTNARRTWAVMSGYNLGTSYAVCVDPVAGTVLNATAPWTWAAGDTIGITLRYKARYA